jgi:N-acetylgalactosamine-6-sulfatase
MVDQQAERGEHPVFELAGPGGRWRMFRLLLAVLSLLGTVATSTASERPNVVFILLDDLGWGDFHCYGHPYSKTPHIDRLAAEGTRFEQCYATGVTCCPSRTGFMTSKFPATFATYPANGGFGDRMTITELLKKQGYATGHFGKWHIGPTTSPGTYGIDVIGGEKIAANEPPPAATRCRDAHIFDEAGRFIEEHRQTPFYVNVWCHIPHHPIRPSRQLVSAFGPLMVDEAKFSPAMQEKLAQCKKSGGDVSQHMQAYLAELKAVDEEVGALVRRIDELGLGAGTIIVVSSDQGSAPQRDPSDPFLSRRKAARADMEVRRNALGYNGPFRGGKHNQYEGGVRIPFIVRWPGHVPAGRTDKASVISGADWLPTLCSLTDTPVGGLDIDGEDASAAWLGKASHVRSRPLLWKTSSANSAAAIRDGRWKLHAADRRKGEIELYDLSVDPSEEHNVADRHPDTVRSLSAKIAAWQATLPKTYDKISDGDK